MSDRKRVAQEIFTLSEEETYQAGRRLAESLRGGELLLLQGELGLGKTVFARGIAAGLGIDPDEVSSPSFTLVQPYEGGRLPMFHVDLYRIQDIAEIETLGLDDVLHTEAVVVIEWGERLPAGLADGALTIRFHELGPESRRLEIMAGRPTGRADA